MTIDLNDLIQDLAPDRLELKLGGGTFVVNDLTIAQVLKLATLGTLENPDEARAAIEFISTLFKDRVPPQLDALLASFAAGDDESVQTRQTLIQQAGLITNAIGMACNEVAAGKKLAAATETLRQRLEEAYSESSSG